MYDFELDMNDRSLIVSTIITFMTSNYLENIRCIMILLYACQESNSLFMQKSLL